MNRIYKKVWSKLRGCFVAVSEALGSNQSRGKLAAAVVLAVASTSPAFATNYTDQTFEGDGNGAYGLGKGHGTTHNVYGITTFIGRNGGMGARLWSDGGEIYNRGTVHAYGYGSDQDNTTSWGIKSTWGIYRSVQGAEDFFYGYGGSGNKAMGVGMELADWYDSGSGGYKAHIIAEGGSGNTSWGVGVAFNRQQNFGKTAVFDMQVKGGTGEHASGIGMFNGWSLSGIALLANNHSPVINNSGTITGTIAGGSAYGALGIGFLTELNWTNNGTVSLDLTGGSVEGATAYGIYQRGGTYTNNGTLTITSVAQNEGKARPWNDKNITNNGTLKLIGDFGDSIYWANLKQTKGQVQTAFGNFGEYTTGVEYYAQTLAAIGSSGVISTESMAFAHGEGLTVTDFDVFASLAGITGGDIYITDKNFTSTGQDAIRDYLIAAGISEDVTVSFAGTADYASTAGTPVYSVENANKFLAEAGHVGLTLQQVILDSEIKDLVVGAETGLIDSIGFKSVSGVDSLTVAEGFTFNLLGDGTTAANYKTFVDGTLKLGNQFDSGTNGGSLDVITIGTNGTLAVDRGSFTAAGVDGSGSILINDQGILTTTNLSVGKTLANDGELTVTGNLQLGEESSFTQSASGSLTTNQDNLFQNVYPAVDDPLNVISVAAQLPEAIRVVADELFQKYVPGEVAESLAEHATFTGGKVIVTGVDLTTTQVVDLTQAFKEKLSLPGSITESNAFPVAFV